MNRILAVLAGGLLIGAFAAAYAELPPLSPQEKAAEAAKAQKAVAEKEKAAKHLARAQDKAVANYKQQNPSSAPAASRLQEGADHSNVKLPDAELTREEAQTEMPKPGQANDHSTTARDPR